MWDHMWQGTATCGTTCRPSVLGPATKTRPPVAKQSGQCARALLSVGRCSIYTLVS